MLRCALDGGMGMAVVEADAARHGLSSRHCGVPVTYYSYHYIQERLAASLMK